ncbi:MAG: FAD-binding oxidoreductase [Anaerolineaceae bacterium]|nr:FAD-binding oxidoreductase [Anaerolineaceae bacterium]
MTPDTIPHYDVIIIGAGSIGAPAAFYLAKAGFKTLVVDSGASVGQGSNKKAIGGIRATHSDPAKIQLSLRSIEIFSTWKETYGDDIEWYKGGYLFMAYREREEKILKDLLITQKKLGLNIDWYDSKNLLAISPDLNPNDLIGGTFSPDDGNASPLLAIHAFYAHAINHGAEFRFNEPVTELIIKSGKIAGVKTTAGTYGADIVINAAGPWAAHIGKLAGITIPVNPDSHESAITEPVARFFDPMIVDIRPAPGSSNFYFYQHITGQIIFCITPSPNIWGFDTRETSDFLPMVARRMIEVMPRLRNIRVRRTWRGLYPMTPDGYPIIGWTKEVEGFLQAVGLCGQGFMLGPGLAELLVRMVQNKITVQDEEILSYVSLYRNFGVEELLK